MSRRTISGRFGGGRRVGGVGFACATTLVISVGALGPTAAATPHTDRAGHAQTGRDVFDDESDAGFDAAFDDESDEVPDSKLKAVDPTVARVTSAAVRPSERRSGAGAAVEATEVADGFQTVGVTWPGDDGSAFPELQVRARGIDGAWSEWVHLELASDTADEEPDVRVSAPVFMGESDAVDIATVDSGADMPKGIELTLVSSEQVDSSAASSSGKIAASRATAAPTIITRDEWGAAPACDLPPDYDGATWLPAKNGLRGAAIHHTVNPNSYGTVAEAMQAIRNNQAYHQDTRGWCDIGYNFLVDKWGNIYEGAEASIEEPIIGAHTGGFNTGTVGIALLGTFTSESGVTPRLAQRDAAAHVAGYRLAEFGVHPEGSATFTAASHTSDSRYEAGDRVELPRVFAHRDTHITQCPGQLTYDRMAQIQNLAEGYALRYLPVGGAGSKPDSSRLRGQPRP